MRSTLRRRLPTVLLGLLVVVTFASPALADALVVVQVQTESGSPVDGQVTLRPRGGGGESFSCTTEAGECQIPHVPGGRYTVQFDPTEGDAPPPKAAMIPPAGRVTLHVAAR